MVEEGKMSRNYCLDCKSKKVTPLSKLIVNILLDIIEN